MTIIGTGMMGCSLAVNFKEHWQIIGVDTSADNLRFALSEKYIHETLLMERAIAISNIVILATPADITLQLIPSVLDASNANTVVMDICSTKQTICQSIAHHPHRSRFVATHPMAGTEKSGSRFTTANLFEGKRIAFCEPEKSSGKALWVANNLAKQLRMIPFYISPEQHDKIMAQVSHLPQATAYCLSNAISNSKELLEWTGTGFESTTRLAKSEAAIWLPILFQNKINIAVAIRKLIENLEATIDALETDDYIAMHGRARANGTYLFSHFRWRSIR
jgi:Prephenate dehydrogenase